MPNAVTFLVSNATASHQITLEQDAGNSRTILATIDGEPFALDDCSGFDNGMSFQSSSGLTVMIAATTITVILLGHVTFSGIITDHDSGKILTFIRNCGLPIG